MNKDFSKYKKIIDEFSGQVLTSDFETKFYAVSKNLSQTDRFLLKMELKRLAAPCTRLIDLRGHVDGECKIFQHEQRIHFLDKVASLAFTEAFTRYGSYSLGVYEATMNTENNFRVIYQKEKAQVNKGSPEASTKIFEKSQYPAKLYSFGPYHNRIEERMNFVISIQVTIDNDRTFKCTTLDLSVSGCKFKVNDLRPIGIGQKITLRFSGLEEQFQLMTNSDFTYEVKSLTVLDNMQLVGVKRTHQDKFGPDSFTQYMISFIQGNKRRYKINLDNTISALQARSFEQYVLPKSNELPVFIEKNNTSLTPKYALTCHNNQGLYQYWQDEQHDSTLFCLITPERITQLKKLALSGQSLLVFSFIHQNQGKSYFYTADELQLGDDPEFMTQFLAFAAAKENFLITQLALLDLVPSRAQPNFTLSNSITEKNAYLDAPISNEIQALLAKTPYIVVVNDVTKNESMKAYQSWSYEGINSVKLKKFGHKRLSLSEKSSVDNIGINYRNKRQELRFTYKTPVHVQINHLILTGVSLDFSPSGLKVSLDKTTLLLKGDMVYLSFPKLQKVTSAFDLTDLPYEVVRVNSAKNIINLRIFVQQHQHIGRRFFKFLIDKNSDKLTSDEYDTFSADFARALRNIYSASLTVPALVIQTSGSRYKSEVIAGGDCRSNLMSVMQQLSDGNLHYNLYPILGHADIMPSFSVKLKKMQQTDSPSCHVLYIAHKASVDTVEKAVSIKLSSELNSEELKQDFIHQALKKGQFFCLMIKLSRVGEPDMSYLHPELSYISAYALHRGKQIEQNIWSVSGIAQIFDITQEELFRYRLTHKA
jgi:hypothetical protein